MTRPSLPVLVFALAAPLAACQLTLPWDGAQDVDGEGRSVTASTDHLEFSALEGGAVPQAKTVEVSTRGQAVLLTARFSDAASSWLSFTSPSASLPAVLHVAPITTALAPGTHHGTLVLEGLNSRREVVDTVQIAITFDVRPRLAASAAAPAVGFTYGDAASSSTSRVAVSATGKTWAATSDVPWLMTPPATRTGDGAFDVAIDASTLPVGQAQGRVTVRNAADADDHAEVTFTVTVTAPTLEVSPSVLVLGGQDGLGAPTGALQVSLLGGTTAHPLAVTHDTASGGAWLAATPAAGTAGTAQVTVSADRTVCGPGTFTGNVRVQVTVKELTLTKDVPVTANLERHSIQASAAGVGLSSTAGRSVLSRTLRILDSLGRTDVPWAASSDEPWLTVTASGTTGGGVTLTANPAGLSPEQTHFATVTVTSSDPSVEGAATVRVGLYVTAATPTLRWAEETQFFLAASPVEPVVFLAPYGGSTVTVRHFYTGDVVRTFAGVAASIGGLAVGPDGRHLYVYDRTNYRVTQVDAETGGAPRHFSSTKTGSDEPLGAMAAFDAGGRSWLVTPSSRVYDLATAVEQAGGAVSGFLFSHTADVTGDGALAVLDTGLVYGLRVTALRDRPFSASMLFSAAGGRDSCLRADGAVVYSAPGWPYEFPGTSTATHLPIQTLPGMAYPNAIECPWNGLVVGGANAYYDLDDIFVYDGASGVLLDRLSSSRAEVPRRSLRDRGLAVSADGARVVSLTESSYASNETTFQSLPAP